MGKQCNPLVIIVFNMITVIFQIVAIAQLLPVFSAEDEAVIPAWSVGAFSSVCAVGIMSASDPAGIVDRAQCAQMLSSAMDAVK